MGGLGGLWAEMVYLTLSKVTKGRMIIFWFLLRKRRDRQKMSKKNKKLSDSGGACL